MVVYIRNSKSCFTSTSDFKTNILDFLVFDIYVYF